MGRFGAIFCFVIVLGLMSSASSAPALALSPKAGRTKASPVQSPKAASPASAPVPTAPTVSSPASAPSKVATPASSATSPSPQTPASSPSPQGPATAPPKSTNNGVVSATPSLKNIAIFGTALVGGAVFIL